MWGGGGRWECCVDCLPGAARGVSPPHPAGVLVNGQHRRLSHVCEPAPGSLLLQDVELQVAGCRQPLCAAGAAAAAAEAGGWLAAHDTFAAAAGADAAPGSTAGGKIACTQARFCCPFHRESHEMAALGSPYTRCMGTRRLLSASGSGGLHAASCEQSMCEWGRMLCPPQQRRAKTSSPPSRFPTQHTQPAQVEVQGLHAA